MTLINELSSLSGALERAGIIPAQSYKDYKPLPNVTAKAPCIRIWVKDGKCVDFESVGQKQAKRLRKFGSNQASFPGMNLISLYRVTEESGKELIERYRTHPEDTDVSALHALCTEDAWEPHQNSRLKNCFLSTPNAMRELLLASDIAEDNLLYELMRQCSAFSDAHVLHESLAELAFSKLEKKQDISLALLLLFQLGDPQKQCKDDKRNISVIFDTDAYESYGMYIASDEFTDLLNHAFLQAEQRIAGNNNGKSSLDSFGEAYTPLNAPMPKVKLAAGFDPALYTMFDGQPCQNRYHNFDSNRDSYPLSSQHRVQFQAALNWLGGDTNNKGVTWLSTGKGEAVFAYPSSLSSIIPAYVQFFGKPLDQSDTFKDVSHRVLTAFNGLSQAEKPKNVQVFVLRKIDKGRTKIVYSHSTASSALMEAAERWETACTDLPSFPGFHPQTPFPINISSVINTVWRQDGEFSTTTAMHPYEGIELFMLGEHHRMLRHYLHILVQHSLPLALYSGSLLHGEKKCNRTPQLEQLLPVLSMLLTYNGIRKDDYMESTPYLMGQMLKASDELHALYCKVVRNNQIPPQLVGAALYTSASEMPSRTIGQLSLRVKPYLDWARQYSNKNEEFSGLAGWYRYIYETIANKLGTEFLLPIRWDDYQKAQLFIGYLAAFPKREKPDDNNENKGE